MRDNEGSMTKEQLNQLARTPNCPRCTGDKTIGHGLCSRCRSKLPAQMRAGVEGIRSKDAWTVVRALRAAANYFDVHFQSVRNFGGGRKH